MRRVPCRAITASQAAASASSSTRSRNRMEIAIQEPGRSPASTWRRWSKETGSASPAGETVTA